MLYVRAMRFSPFIMVEVSAPMHHGKSNLCARPFSPEASEAGAKM
jgi:hypothetical protein